ncbi:MAG TPA: I78 family peptidase inhibitor [Terricaulis sp.]|nr:I78 family peptidase inhibitor [Terricaulis sp.]HRP10155.1 I78 family peptidase inhibitor [Terricaulis sp.]
MRALVVALALLAAPACTHAVADAPAAPQNAGQASDADTCGMAAYERYIGRPASEIDRASLPARTRIITPEMAVTMDYRAERLNIMVGTDGRVGSLRCF